MDNLSAAFEKEKTKTLLYDYDSHFKKAKNVFLTKIYKKYNNRILFIRRSIIWMQDSKKLIKLLEKLS